MPTIYESFREALDPDHVGPGRKVSGGSDGNVHVSVPSTTTRTYEPPNFLLKIPESKWLSIADSALDKHKSKLNHKNARLAPWESNMRMDSEGDVVYGSAIYLNNPVHIALHAAQNHSRACDVRSEVTLGTTSRADLGYFRNGQAYAILEYKKLGAVSKRCARREFDRGVPKDPNMFAAWMSTAENRFMRNHRGAEDTRALLQQAVHYHYKFGARFVALFDWNALVLLVLPPCGGLGLNDSVSYAYITEVTDNRKFRRALLGFLLFSYRNSIGETFGDLEKIRPDVFSSYAQAYHRRVAENMRPKNTSTGRGTRGNQHPTALGNRYVNTKVPPAKSYQGAHTAAGYGRNTAITNANLKAHSEDGYRLRQQRAGGQLIPDHRGRHQDPSSGASIYTTASSNHSNAANSTVIHTYITLPSRDETKSPGRRIRKQPSSSLATNYGSGGATVNTQNRSVAARQVHPTTTVGDRAGLYGGTEQTYGGRTYMRSTPGHFSAHNGDIYREYPGPSSYQVPGSASVKRVPREKFTGNQRKEKNSGKFLGIFGRG